jgi:hypothetical protein
LPKPCWLGIGSEVGAGDKSFFQAAIPQKAEISTAVTSGFKRQEQPSTPAFETSEACNGGKGYGSNTPEEDKQASRDDCHHASRVTGTRIDGKCTLRKALCISVDKVIRLDDGGLGAASGQDRCTQNPTNAVRVGRDGRANWRKPTGGHRPPVNSAKNLEGLGRNSRCEI